MSLALHAHQVFIIATLVFVVSVLIPFWYTSPNGQIQRHIFQICNSNGCYWSLIPTSNNPTLQTSRKDETKRSLVKTESFFSFLCL